MLNSEEVDTLNKYHELINKQFNIYVDYINNVMNNKQKFNFLFYHSMILFYENVIDVNINDKYTNYVKHILDSLKKFSIHKQYLRILKLKKINELNDTKN